MSSDLEERRRRLDAVKHRFRSVPDPDVALGQLPVDLQDSWRRCGRLVRPESVAPVDLDDPATAWRDSPIRRAGGASIDELATLARGEDYVAAITDDRGRIIWSSAGASMVRAAEQANFVRGANWSESVAGTNAPGLALRTGRPAAVFASEHWCETVTDWVCYAAPIRDRTGRVLGAIDLSAHWRRAHPLALTTIATMARLIEHEIATSEAVTGPDMRIAVLGRPQVSVQGSPLSLTNRHLEILTLLARHDRLSLVELQDLLYGERAVSAGTVKAEVSRLRALLGDGIESRPYRLRGTVELDVTTALDALGRGDLETALVCYRGPLLPTSDSPHLRQLGHHIDVALSNGLLRDGTADQLIRFAERTPNPGPFLDRARMVLAPDPTRGVAPPPWR